MEQGIFISYRRQDSQSAAGRLTDHLKDHLPGVPIFRDVETIEPGVDFVDAIEKALRACKVLVAVIGPRWLDAAHEDGSRRLDDPNDYTRLEIATALKRKDVRVIPILVEGAVMPATARLPDDLAALARRNAVELTDKRWDFDVSQLVETLRATLGLPDETPTPPPPDDPPRGGSSKRAWWIGAAVVLGLAFVGTIIEEEAGAPAPYVPESYDPVTPAINDGQSGGGTSSVPLTPPAAAPINLTGMWRDSEGGVHEIYQQGNQLQFRGQTPDGFVSGTGILHGHQGETTYLYNGYTLHSRFSVSADGMQMDVIVIDPATNQREATQLFRMQ